LLTLLPFFFFFTFTRRDVCAYGEAIADALKKRGVLGFNYSIATEHEHSCCILLAREDKFLIDGTWHTWIDYDRFQQLMVQYYESKKACSESKGDDDDRSSLFTFASTDYMAPTPSWATYKSDTRGFDPAESRWKRTKTGKMVEIEYKSSESGCG
jgi:tRNA wybutosine-synthesizing protein 1